MTKNDKVINCNVITPKGENINYQLIRNEVIETENDNRITFYSIMVNTVINNSVIESSLSDDISRNLTEAQRLFESISGGGVPAELTDEIIAELIG